MQYHWVVMFDENTQMFEVDWDTTTAVLFEADGVAYDTATGHWVLNDEQMNTRYKELSNQLGNQLYYFAQRAN